MWYGPSWNEDFKPNHASLKKIFPKKILRNQHVAYIFATV